MWILFIFCIPCLKSAVQIKFIIISILFQNVDATYKSHHNWLIKIQYNKIWE